MTTTKTSINISKLGYKVQRETEKAVLFQKDLKIGRLNCSEVATAQDTRIALHEEIWVAKALLETQGSEHMIPLWLYAQNHQIRTSSLS